MPCGAGKSKVRGCGRGVRKSDYDHDLRLTTYDDDDDSLMTWTSFANEGFILNSSAQLRCSAKKMASLAERISFCPRQGPFTVCGFNREM